MWIEITENDILTVLAGPELSAYRAAAKANGQEDPVPPSIHSVTQLIRGFVMANKANVLGEGNVIPERLLTVALDILAVRIPGRVGTTPSEVRAENQKTAMRILDRVADGSFDIGETQTPSTEKSHAQSPRINARPPQFKRADEDGI